ncbi:MAG: beta-lactamase family protein [Polyangiaceae bacterium]|nr:beta-lactamase family protein [Polyangiaceae bacterium]
MYALPRLRFLLPLVLVTACSSSEGVTPPPPSDAGAAGDAPIAPTVDGGTDGATSGCSAAQKQAITDSMSAKLDAAATDPAITKTPDFTLLLETEDGRSYAHSHGSSTATTVYESASTSKLIAAAVILDVLDQGLLTLETKAHDLLPFWTETTVTLRHLLSFTSGFSDEPLCINLPGADFETCVESMYTKNAATAPAAGSQFYYSSVHLQVAGLMAMKAKKVATWTDLFEAWKTKTGLFPTAKFDLPSASNPRLAGGVHWTATEYLGFLRALAKGTILKAATRTELFANQRGAAVVMASPASRGTGEDWAYGLGNWLECPGAKGPNTYNCGSGHRNSSAGAYGAYPFIDFDHHYFGILARQGELATGFEGVAIVRAAQAPTTQWADGTCTP